MGPRRHITFPLFGDGIFTQDGAEWKHSREVLRPQFLYKQYQDLEVFREHVDNLISSIPTNGGVIDLQPLFFRFTLDTTTAFLFGKSVYSLDRPGATGETNFAEAFNTAQSYVAMRFRLQDLYWLIGGKKFNAACATVHSFAAGILHRSLEEDLNTGEEEDSRFALLRVVKKDSRDDTAMRHQIVNILVAGRDTTACLLSWTL